MALPILQRLKMEFKLTEKTYKDEVYESQVIWRNKKVTAMVNMHYHTIRKYWHVNYSYNYNKRYTHLVTGESYIDKRKEARKIAQKYMQEASVQDIDNKFDDFHKKSILEAEDDW